MESENAHSDVVIQRRQRRAVLDDSSSELESEEEELAVVRRRRKNALDSESETDDDETEVVDLRESVGESPLAGVSKPSVVIPRTTAIDVAARSSTTFTKTPTPTMPREPNVPITKHIGDEDGGKPLRLKAAPGGGPKFELQASLANALYDHQIQGVRWMWHLHSAKRGGILADDMGLGKTLQAAAFATGLIRSGAAARVLVLADPSILPQWEKEFTRACGLTLGETLWKYSGDMKKSERDRHLDACVRGRGVLLASYTMATRNAAALGAPGEDGIDADADAGEGRGAAPKSFAGAFRWDWVIMDEGHKLKSSNTQLSHTIRQLPINLRLIVTGTPMGTDLGELWALYDLTCPGLLGSEREFRRRFVHKIHAGQAPGATQKQRTEAKELSAELRQLTAPYYLRRDKKSLFCEADSKGDVGEPKKPTTKPTKIVDRKDISHVPAALGQKNDLIAWIPLEPAQCELYTKFCASKPVRDVVNKTGSAITCMNVLKKICDHPSTVCGTNDGDIDDTNVTDFADDENENDDDDAGARKSSAGEAALAVAAAARECSFDSGALADADASCSSKMQFLMHMLERFKTQGHRALVFSQSQTTLDVIQRNVERAGLSFLRVDGKVSADERHRRVTEFQTRDDVQLMLLTARVGGMGLTLTAATRVIIYDPAWNPSMDNQSVDRAFRIGQHRDVVCYRLITCGSIEEKIYRKQVFKGALSKSVTDGGGNCGGYFGADDASRLFDVDVQATRSSVTMRELNALHAADRKWTDELRDELAYVHTLSCVCGVSDHDLLFNNDDSSSASASAPTKSTGVKASTPKKAAPSGAAWKNVNSGWGGDGSILGVNLLAAVSPARAPVKTSTPDDDSPARGGEAKLRAKLAEHQATIDKQNVILSMPAVVNTLPDKGVKLRQGIASLRAEMAVISAEIQAKYCAAAAAKDVDEFYTPEGSPEPDAKLETMTSLAESIDELGL